ncbi:MAG: apolipoprotein N-acyltransferase [Ectothiorhodospiraceae bacterium]|nr:apolipoprotein N-acyltransferase [Chromatiales bacterium]MCP5156751.1 apolipoprotein N-acyltransferase [Ectothiorhodospiraceae bacterium]
MAAGALTRHRFAPYVLALLAGLVLPLAFSPFDLVPVAVLSPAVLFHLWRTASARGAAWLGWWWGVGAFGAGVSWIHESFRFSHILGLLPVVLTAGFVAFLALYPALLGAVLRARSRASGGVAFLVLACPGGWVVVEWLRGHLLTGFTWLQLGYAHTDAALGGLLATGGVYLVGIGAAVTAGALAALVVPGLGRRRRAALLGAVVALWLGAWGIGQVRWTVPDGEWLDVALIQGNVPQDQKWLPEMREPTLRRYLDLTRERLGRSDLVVWPETALPGFYHQMTDVVRALAAEASPTGTRVLLGVPVADARTRTFMNSVLLLGEVPELYHKRHLVPFGEYLPLAPVLRPVVDALGIRVADFSPGPAEQPPMLMAGTRLAVSVCYEIAFGAEIARELPAAGLLVTVSNDAWFGRSIGPHQHLEIARARARETGRWLLRATNTGITAIVDPAGAITGRIPQFETAVLEGRVRPMAGATPYVRLGDWPAVVLAGAMFLLGRFARRKAVAGR